MLNCPCFGHEYIRTVQDNIGLIYVVWAKYTLEKCSKVVM